jgi:amino acid adenylation domain-containing protein
VIESLFFDRILDEAPADAPRAAARSAAAPRAVSDEERHKVLVLWSTGATAETTRDDVDADATWHGCVEAQVARAAAAPAVRFLDRQLSYGELNEQANRLAHYLRSAGVAPGVCVGIALPRSPELIVGVLAVLKAGGAYVALDPEYPADRRAFMLRDARTRLILTDRATAARLGDDATPRLHLDADRELYDARPATNLDPVAGPDDAAYVLYTSGSTGTPNGAVCTHRGVCNLIRGATFGIGPGDRVLQFASMNFDASVWEILAALATGATLVLAPREALRPGPELARTCAEHAVTVALLGPSVLKVLRPEDFPTLATVCAGGEACTADVVARWAPGRRMFNLYGPTEATVLATYARCDAGAPPIGRPIENVEVYLLDAAMEPVAVGDEGELYIGGVGLAHGYAARPALTAERFVPHPFGPPGARLYRTGDLARYRPDGNLEFVGRADQQVKVRGFRIELGEVEAVLATYPGVRAAVAAVRELTPGDASLVGYVVAPPGTADAHELRAFLEARLPPQMVPTAFVEIDTLPMTPNGKLDRAALPAPDGARGAMRGGYVAPRTPDERILVEIWESVLSVQPIGVADDFFTIGGHSLSALRVVAAIQKHLHVTIPIAQILKLRTIEAIARALRSRSTAKRPSALVPLNRSGAKPPLFVVHPAGGNVLCYRELAGAFRPGQPVVGVQAKGVSLDEEPSRDVTAMAEEYVAAIRSANKDGPYHLAGWSFGAVAAVEMARLLLAAGCRVGGVMLLDPPTPTRLHELDPLREILMFARAIGVSFSEEAMAALTAATATDALIERAEATKLFPPGFGAIYAKKLAEVYEASILAARAHAPARISARLTLIRASESANEVDGDGWDAYSDAPVSVFRVNASHEALLRRPAVAELAALMESIVDRENAAAT